MDLGRRGRPNAQASVGFVPGAKARSAHQSRGLASLVRVTWCFDCSPHGSAGSTGHAEAVVGFTCPKPAGRRCWVATAGDCTYVRHLTMRYSCRYQIPSLCFSFHSSPINHLINRRYLMTSFLQIRVLHLQISYLQINCTFCIGFFVQDSIM